VAEIVWALEPEFSVRRRGQRRGVATPPDGGFVQRRQLVDRELPAWVLTWKHCRRSAMGLLEYYWAETKRGVVPMLYTPPDEPQLRVCIASFTRRWTSSHGGEAEVVLEAIR
jgi:hypothetical protein